MRISIPRQPFGIVFWGVCCGVSALGQIGLITNIGATASNMDALAFNSNGVLYGASGGGRAGSLYTIDPATGAATLIGPLVGATNSSLTYSISGLAFQPGTGVLYASIGGASPDSFDTLATIDPVTAKVTVIGPTGSEGPYPDLAFASNGTLYAWLVNDTVDGLATVNLSTGTGTFVGSQLSNTNFRGDGLAISPSGVIYSSAPGVGGALWVVNAASGSPTGVGTLTGGPEVSDAISALAFSPSGVLYGINGGDGGKGWNLVTIAISSGPAPTVSGVQNGAQGTALCPGDEAIVTGTGFGTTAAAVFVTVGGKLAYIIGTPTSTQVMIQIPFGIALGAENVIVTVGGNPSSPFGVTLAATAPAWTIQGGSITGAAQVYESGTNTLVALSVPAGSPPGTAVVTAKPGDTLYAFVIGLGATNPASPTGPQTVANPTAATPSVTLGGIAAIDVTAVLTVAQVAIYQVTFTVPPGAQGTVPLVISIGGANSPDGQATIAVVGISAVTNNASFAHPGVASPGSIATVFANGLGTSTDEVSGVFPQSQSEGVQVTFTGVPANNEGGPIFHVIASSAQQQIDLLVPTDLPSSGMATVQLSTSTTKYPNYTLNMVAANPGLYRIPDPAVKTRFNVIAQFNNTVWLALPASTTTALGLPACTKNTSPLTLCGRPATGGDVLVIYATGLGLATPGGDPNGTPLATGQVAPVSGSPLYKTPQMPSVSIGGVPVTTVYFSGLAPGFAGLYQIDVLVPDGIKNSDDAAVTVTMAGASDTATISIQPPAN